jgi:hypothetical protein
MRSSGTIVRLPIARTNSSIVVTRSAGLPERDGIARAHRVEQPRHGGQDGGVGGRGLRGRADRDERERHGEQQRTDHGSLRGGRGGGTAEDVHSPMTGVPASGAAG